MSFVEPSTLQVIADSVGIPKLSTDAAKALAPDVEYRIREIIQVGLDCLRSVMRQ
jgi:transcription initiation factor TFIID subunit 6